jgi:hypothetical protein
MYSMGAHHPNHITCEFEQYGTYVQGLQALALLVASMDLLLVQLLPVCRSQLKHTKTPSNHVCTYNYLHLLHSGTLLAVWSHVVDPNRDFPRDWQSLGKEVGQCHRYRSRGPNAVSIHCSHNNHHMC